MARGGGNAGKSKGRSRGPMGREETVSKKLAWLLRHGANSEGVKLGRGGYANLQQVLQSRAIKSINPVPTLSEISNLVSTNAKQRFSLIHVSNAPAGSSAPATASEPVISDSGSTDLETVLKSDSDPANYLIRANQGHSVQLESGTDDLLKPITVEAGNLPTMVVHGTRKEHWSKIVASGGLKPMTRNHVHFATGLPAKFKSAFATGKSAAPVATSSKNEDGEEVTELPEKKEALQTLSGMRNTSTVLMFLDLRKALDNGLLFYLSENGVVLSKGNDDGIIGLEFFERVEDRDGNSLLEGVELSSTKTKPVVSPETSKDSLAEWNTGRQANLPIREKDPPGQSASDN